MNCAEVLNAARKGRLGPEKRRKAFLSVNVSEVHMRVEESYQIDVPIVHLSE